MLKDKWRTEKILPDVSHSRLKFVSRTEQMFLASLSKLPDWKSNRNRADTPRARQEKLV